MCKNTRDTNEAWIGLGFGSGICAEVDVSLYHKAAAPPMQDRMGLFQIPPRLADNSPFKLP